jgi:hypothetical protein
MKHQIDEEVEAERLRHVRAQIEELLQEFDVCGVVFLAGRAGRFEHFNQLTATWSNLRFVEAPGVPAGIGVRSRLADYGGDVERQKQELEWSVGVVSCFAQALGMVAMQWLPLAEKLDEATNATHTPWKRDDSRDGQ